ncbi:hypothetical protein AF333_29040 [Aneurinibacillus migulanus]|nr:hypothetical protein AF333_29040 [Aneurinibacillus migulanus]
MIKNQCNPNCPSDFGEVFDIFFSSQSSNFVGGQGDKRRTTHENMFSMLYPHMKQQVHFGTGKGGLEEYLSKRFTADFYDEENNIIYEIDGDNHKTEIKILKDKIRDYFFYHELGIRTVRLTNQQVEEMMMEKLLELERKGLLSDVIRH